MPRETVSIPEEFVVGRPIGVQQAARPRPGLLRADAGNTIEGTAGEGMATLGKEIANLGAHLEGVRIKAQAHAAQAEYAERVTDLEIETMRDPDWRSASARFDERHKELLADISSRMATDPQARSILMERAREISLPIRKRIAGETRKREIDTALAAYQDADERLLLAGIKDPSEIETVRVLVEAGWRQAVDDGLLLPQDAQKRTRETLSRLDEGSVSRLVANAPGMAKQALESPEWSRIWPYLSPERQLSLMEAAQKKIDREETEALRQKEHEERAAEKRVKEAQDLAEYKMGGLADQGKLRIADIDDAVAMRTLDPKAGERLRNKVLRPEEARAVKNNPLVVGELAEGLEMGADISQRLETARDKGQINGDTYVSLKRGQADRNYKAGLAYLSRALKPGEFDKYDARRSITYADAVDDYTRRVASGEKPMEAARDVVLDVQAGKPSAYSVLQPKFLTGTKDDPAALDEAERKTVEAFRAKRIEEREYSREIRAIEALRRLQKENTQALDADTQKRIEEETKGRKKAVK